LGNKNPGGKKVKLSDFKQERERKEKKVPVNALISVREKAFMSKHGLTAKSIIRLKEMGFK
jgi:hypothetical protein